MSVTRAGKRGMTLIEVLVVVAVIGVLAMLAIAGYNRWLKQARVSDGKNVMLGVVQGLTQYYQDTGGYLDCSGDWTDYYPMAPNGKKHHFHNPKHADYACWQLFTADSDATTYLSFVVRAGVATTPMPQPPTKQQFLNTWNGATNLAKTPWYVLLAVGDMDEDGVKSYWVASSRQPSQIHVENEAE